MEKKKMPNEVPKWVNDQKATMKKQAEEDSKFFKFPEGETEILVDVSEAPIIVKKFGDKTRYQHNIAVKINGQDTVKALEIGKQLETQLIEALSRGINPMTVIRIGTDINSKYSVKGL